MFDVIKNRGHRPGTEFFRPSSSKRDHGVTCSPLPKVNRQKIKQNVDPDHCTFSDVQYGWRFAYYYITAIHNVNKESMSVMLPRHQNWYIQKDLRLVHTKFSSVIEVFITVCF